MPPYYMEFEAKRLGNNIGYVWFNHWAEPVDAKFIAALSSMRDIRMLIIDLRGSAWPALSPVNALPTALRLQTHNSGPMCLATPSSCGTSVHYLTPVFTGAP
jgi:hypothetical protein